MRAVVLPVRAPLADCPACGAPAFKKQLTAAGFQLKGSGWYATDFRNSGAKPAAKAAEASKPEAKPEAKTEAKSDAKSEGAKDSAAPACGSGACPACP